MDTKTWLEALADALDAASAVLRERALLLPASGGVPADADLPEQESRSAVDVARALHPSLGPRQAQVIELLEEAGVHGLDTGKLSRTMRYDRPNVYLTLDGLPKDWVEKDESTRPQTYRLTKKLAYRLERALAKYKASGAAALGIPSPVTYSNIDGDESMAVFVGPDATGNTVVVQAGEILLTSATRGEAMEFYKRLKLRV